MRGPQSDAHDQRMPRYLIERTFPDGLEVPTTKEGAKALVGIIDNNATEGVTWVHSYVSADRQRTYCIYDAPDPEAIRAVNEVRVLDPYFYVESLA